MSSTELVQFDGKTSDMTILQEPGQLICFECFLRLDRKANVWGSVICKKRSEFLEHMQEHIDWGAGHTPLDIIDKIKKEMEEKGDIID